MAKTPIANRTYQAGQEILREGAPGTEMFFVDSGMVELWKGPKERRTTLGYLEKGGVFGELAVIDGKGRMCSATATQQTKVRVIPKAFFLERLASSDPFFNAIFVVMSQNIRSLSAQVDKVLAAEAKKS